MHHKRTFGFLGALVIAGCTATATTSSVRENDDVLTFDEFLDQKRDSGYVGNKAFEMDVRARGRVRVLLAGKTAEEIQTIAERLRMDPSSEYEITSQVGEQLKFARNKLKSEKLDLNLEYQQPTLTSIDIVEGGLDLSYEVRLESLIKRADLERDGRTIEDYVGRQFTASLPLVPAGLRARIGNTCFTDSATGMAPTDADLTDYNLFYYYDPARSGCRLTASDLSEATIEVISSIESRTVYPEYDRLTEDGHITMATIFGQMDHNYEGMHRLKDDDAGFYFYENFVSQWRDQGFRTIETFADNKGVRLEKTYGTGERTLTITIDAYTPVSFADTVDRDVATQRFRDAISGKEIIFYGGHAGYGSLSVLDTPDIYPADTYQILFMDACYSYAYYTKQVFRRKATTADPTGFVDADVVNNTEAGVSDRPSLALWDNLFKGAVAHFEGGDVTRYSWNAMIEHMNEVAVQQAARRTKNKTPEIFGVSGARTNVYDPSAGDVSGDDDDDSTPIETPTAATCAPAQVTCGDGSCVDSAYVCDGTSDCTDGTDEQGC